MNIADIISKIDEVGFKDATGYDMQQVERANKRISEGKNPSIGDVIHKKRWDNTNERQLKKANAEQRRKAQQKSNNRNNTKPNNTNNTSNTKNNNYNNNNNTRSNRQNNDTGVKVPDIKSINNSTPEQIKKLDARVIDKMGGREVTATLEKLKEDPDVIHEVMKMENAEYVQEQREWLKDYISR